MSRLCSFIVLCYCGYLILQNPEALLNFSTIAPIFTVKVVSWRCFIDHWIVEVVLDGLLGCTWFSARAHEPYGEAAAANLSE
jgi:hypothetical protein